MTIQVFRYALVGLATYVLFIFLTFLFVALNVNRSVSIVIAYILGTFFNYASSAKWVYKGSGSYDPLFGWKSVRYLAAAAFNLILILVINNALLIYVESEFLALVIAPVVSTVINFFIMKQVVFSEKPSHQA
jgi:putative flippase GtrA